jgi:TonB-dependent receptor
MRIAVLCSAAAIFIPSVAYADQDETTAGDTIVVLGARPIAESEAAALRTQRDSDSLVAVASSDGVGRLPDQNIAQATARLPGVAVESDQGQARYISLRGAPNYWTTLSFDGINVVSPEGRDARFDSIPAAIAAQIIVAKAVTPDMPGETVAGNVNVITRSAFDYAGMHLAGKLGYGIAELGNRDQYEGSLVASDRFDTGIGEFGLLVSGSYYERQMVTDNFEIDWEQVSQDRRPSYQTRFWAHEAENKLYRLTRRNWSASGRLDYRPDGENQISLRSVYTIFTDDEARDNFRFDLDDRQNDGSANTADCATTPNLSPTNSGYADVCIGNTPYRGTVYGIDIRQRSTLRAFRQSIFTNTLEGDHTFGDGWTINWLGNYTQSKDDRSVVGESTWDSPSTRNLRPSVAYDFTNPNVSHLRLFTTTQLASPTRYTVGTPVTAIDTFTKPLSGLTVLDAVDTTDAYTGRLIIDRETRLLGGDAVLRAGFQFDQRTKVVDESSIVLNAASAALIGGIPTDYNLFSLDTPFAGKIAMDYTFRYFDTDKMRSASAAVQAGASFLPVTANIYDVREQVYAGFVMGTLDYDWGSLVGGVRIERVENRGIATGITAGSTQTLAFPSLHVNFDVTDEQKLRVSFNTGAARADYDQMRPNVVIDDVNATISGGNPAVRPERAYGVDAYYEYYIVPQGYLMLGGFYKRVEDVLYRQRRAFGSNTLDSNGIDRSGYIFTGITNGGNGRIYGMEAAAQLQLEPWTSDLGLPDWMGGFGINANLTLNNSRVLKPAVDGVPDRYIRLPGTSDAVYNLGAYYEKYGFSARLQYRNRTSWLDGVADTLADGGDTYWASDDEMDFSMRYAITPDFEIYFDAANLLNHPGRRFSEPGNLLTATGIASPRINTQTIEWEQFGRRYTGGVRFNF